MAFLLKRAHPFAQKPVRGSSGAAGYDLYAAEATTISTNEYKAIETGIMTQFPSDHYARVAPRSGLALKNGIDVLAGVVDSDFQATIKVILINHGPEFSIKVGDRIAQLIFERISTPELIDVTDGPVDGQDMISTDRGTNGFGSTGK